MNRRARLFGLALATLSISQASGALLLQLEGDRITLQAESDPLRHILGELARLGIEVEADPDLDRPITARFEQEDVQRAIEAMIRPHSFVLYWDVYEGPVEDIPRLRSIRIFRPGAADRAEAIVADRGIRTARFGGSQGAECVADELLIAARPGTTVKEFLAALRAIGGSLVGDTAVLGVYRVRLPTGTDLAWAVAQMRQHPVIDAVEPNYITRLPKTAVLSAASVPEIPKLPRGTAAPLAVLDSGLRSADTLGDAVAGHFDAVEPGRSIHDPDGHGTQMALIASGAIAPDGVAGHATDAVPLLAVRAFDENGVTTSFALLRSLEYAAANGARVVSLSWGSETESTFIRDALAHTINKGVVVVAAVGNEPTGKPVYPAAYPGVIGVAALTADGTRWTSSNYGPAVDLAAPGTADFPVGHDGPPGSYAGTSIATAYVASHLARFRAAYPDLTTEQALQRFLGALRDEGDQGRDPLYGAGVLDAAALERLR